jgi:hypothetical protein
MNLRTDKTRDTLRSWLADNWRALAVVWIVSLLPFLPTLFSGQILFSSDQVSSPAWRPYFEALRHGELPLWNPASFGGMPTFDAGYGDSLYPPFILLGLLLPVTHVVTFNFMLHILIAGFCAYFLFQRYFRLTNWLAAPLAAAYALNPHFISYIYGGHTGKFHVLAWLPLGLYFLLRTLGPSGSWRSLVGLAVTTALFISTSHLQFTYFVMMGYFFVWLFHFLLPALRGKRFAESGSLVLRFWAPLLLGLGLVFYMVYPPLQYTKDFGVRGAGGRAGNYEHATSWSAHPEETASLLVPEFGGINERYWGRNYFKLNTEAPGLLPWFLGLLGLIAFWRSRWFKVWAAVGLVAILYGLGAHTPVFWLFYTFVPKIDVMRAPSMMLFWLGAALLMMGAEALRRLLATGSEALPEASRLKIGKRLRVTGFTIAGVLALCGLAPDAVYSVWGSLVDASQIPNFANQVNATSAFALGAFRTAVLVAALTWGLTAFLIKARRPVAFGVLALAVALVDTYWVDAAFIKGYPPGQGFATEPAMDYMKSDPSRFRVFGVPGAFERGYTAFHGLESADGWTDNEMSIYRNYRGGDYNQNPTFFAGLTQAPDGSVSGSPFLDLLNVKYLAYRLPNVPGLKIAPNASVLPRAFLVGAWEVTTDTLALEHMKQPGFNPRALAYVSGEGVTSGGAMPDSGRAQVVEARQTVYRVNRQVYTVNAPAEGVLVVSDLWFPHWRVTVDGAAAPLLRANYAFRGVLLKPGAHEVAFEYHSPWLAKSLWISLASLVALLACAFLMRAAQRRRAAAGA